jgi:hypothetical protein
MTLFRNQTHQDIWRQRWCETCFQPDEAQRRLQGKDTECPIWGQALRTGRKPVLWDRNPRADEMERQIRCNAYQGRPAVAKKVAAPVEDVPMFDVEPAQARYVPVPGLPDGRPGEVDHA